MPEEEKRSQEEDVEGHIPYAKRFPKAEDQSGDDVEGHRRRRGMGEDQSGDDVEGHRIRRR